MKPYPKHDYILQRDLLPEERLEPQRNTVRQMQKMLDSFYYVLLNAADDLTEEELDTVAAAVQNAYNAVSNAAYLGISGYHALPVESVRWKTEA